MQGSPAVTLLSPVAFGGSPSFALCWVGGAWSPVSPELSTRLLPFLGHPGLSWGPCLVLLETVSLRESISLVWWRQRVTVRAAGPLALHAPTLSMLQQLACSWISTSTPRRSNGHSRQGPQPGNAPGLSAFLVWGILGNAVSCGCWQRAGPTKLYRDALAGLLFCQVRAVIHDTGGAKCGCLSLAKPALARFSPHLTISSTGPKHCPFLPLTGPPLGQGVGWLLLPDSIQSAWDSGLTHFFGLH